MAERVIKVFYNGECLPFKDKERVVHYPVAQGHIFMGASNTTEIRFYCDQIGGGSNQWIVIGKLPNGKRGFHILGNYLEDEDGGYYSFHLSQFFTQYKGDLYLSLGGYNGNLVELNQEEEYELTGNTLIETTGSIRVTIEYSTPINGSDDKIDNWQELLGALGEKADKGDVILPYISYAILESDYDNYDNGQFYFCEETKTIYRKISGALTPVLVVYSKQQIDNLLNGKVDKLTTSGVYAYIHNGSVQGELAVSTPATGDTIAKRESDGRLKVATPTNNGDATTKGYVDTQLNTRVAKTNVGDKVYGTDESGNQKTFDVDSDFISGENGIVVRRLYPNGQVIVGNPSATNHATPKKYVDDGLALKANKATTYTKTEVDNLVDTIKSGELEIVDTTTYPTLNDFLATTGEEGHIYLYPIDINDLTKGYYRYAWEDISGTEQWVSLGTTEIDLSDYYTKTQADNKFVEQVSGKGLSSNDFTDSDKTKLNGIESNAQVNVIEEIKVDNVALTPSDKSVNIDLSGKQDLLISGTNIKSINNTSLLGSGNIDYDSALSDSSTNAVQNKVLKGYLDDIGNRLAVLEESIISDDSLNYTYLSDSAIPTNANTYPIIESAGMDNTNIKGNSVVYNQLVENGNFVDTSNWSSIYTNLSTFSVSNNKAIITSVSGYFARLRQTGFNFIAGHKYLVNFFTKLDVSMKVQIILKTSLGQEVAVKSSSSLSANTLYQVIDVLSPSSDGSIMEIGAFSNSTQYGQAGDTMEMSNVFCVDLTKAFPTDTPTTTDDPRVQWAIQYAIANPEYNVGTLLNSKPTALISKSFNVWDEEIRPSSYDNNTGLPVNTSTNMFSSKNKIKVIPNESYRIISNGIATGSGVSLTIYYYDKNNNYIGNSTNLTMPRTLTIPTNCYYINFAFWKSGSNWGTTNTPTKNDVKICINISNASLNGTYRPYKAPISYPLNLPVLRSAGSVQDDVSKVNVNTITLGDNETISDFETTDGNCRFRIGYWSVVNHTSSQVPTNIICDKADIISPANWFNMKTGFTIGIAGYGQAQRIQVAIEGVSTSDGAKAWLNGKTIQYQRITPTDQTAITLPENIAIEKGGTITATYDNSAPTPSDFDFEVAVYKPIQ